MGFTTSKHLIAINFPCNHCTAILVRLLFDVNKNVSLQFWRCNVQLIRIKPFFIFRGVQFLWLLRLVCETAYHSSNYRDSFVQQLRIIMNLLVVSVEFGSTFSFLLDVKGYLDSQLVVNSIWKSQKFGVIMIFGSLTPSLFQFFNVIWLIFDRKLLLTFFISQFD